VRDPRSKGTYRLTSAGWVTGDGKPITQQSSIDYLDNLYNLQGRAGVRESVLTEGGNVVPNAQPVTQQNFATVVGNLRRIMPEGITIYPIGSAGKKAVSSDMDVLIDAAELMAVFPARELKQSRAELESYFKQQGLFASRTGVSVHVGVPSGQGEVVQVDVMAVADAAAAVPLHTHDYSEDPAMKGGTLHAIWADLANMSSTPDAPQLMMSPYRGLVNRETKQLITNDKDAIARIIIGPAATADDMRSVKSILRALKGHPEKYRAIAGKYAGQ
jgi:hypothetical protein